MLTTLADGNTFSCQANFGSDGSYNFLLYLKRFRESSTLYIIYFIGTRFGRRSPEQRPSVTIK